jgi:serine/threonine protein kinase
MIDYTGQQIGRYLLQTLIGCGTFRSVYLAHPDGLKEHSVAVKLWHDPYLRSTQEQEQFVQEAEMLAQLRHPHILPLLGSGFYVDHLLPYLVMEYAPGGSLRTLLTSAAPHLLPPAQVLALLTQIGQALHYAHQQQIIHGNVKPENILFTAEGEAVLTDFWMAASQMYQPSSWSGAGVPIYLAEEQMVYGHASPQNDVYALGCVAYELLIGRPSVVLDLTSLKFKPYVSSPAPTQLNPLLLPSTEQVLLSALARKPEERWPSVLAFLVALSESMVTT